VMRWRPIPLIHPKPENSLRYQTILNGALRVYPSGREVCTDTPQGYRLYRQRVEIMLIRQNHRCCLCGNPLALRNATFEHMARRRGMGSAFRDDRIERNGAAHWICNARKG
jgi:hypothetical protein